MGEPTPLYSLPNSNTLFSVCWNSELWVKLVAWKKIFYFLLSFLNNCSKYHLEFCRPSIKSVVENSFLLLKEFTFKTNHFVKHILNTFFFNLFFENDPSPLLFFDKKTKKRDLERNVEFFQSAKSMVRSVCL